MKGKKGKYAGVFEAGEATGMGKADRYGGREGKRRIEDREDDGETEK